MSRLVTVACAVLFSVAVVAFAMRPRPVAMEWRSAATGPRSMTPVIPPTASFAPCEPVVASVGRAVWPPPPVLFTPSLETRAECAVLRAGNAAGQTRGRLLTGLRSRVTTALRFGHG